MKYSEIKTLKSFTEALVSTPSYREVLENVLNGNEDFEVDNVRFISEDSILSVLAEELTSDLYCLGCFNAGFIADQCNWPIELVEATQKGEAFEALGKAIEDNTDMEEFAEAYASEDGYGHHFNSYDGGEEEITINGNTYFVFDNQ
jgi:hypothetical protein